MTEMTPQGHDIHGIFRTRLGHESLEHVRVCIAALSVLG